MEQWQCCAAGKLTIGLASCCLGYVSQTAFYIHVCVQWPKEWKRAPGCKQCCRKYAIQPLPLLHNLCAVSLFVVSECLEYPDFSGIVLYRYVVSIG